MHNTNGIFVRASRSQLLRDAGLIADNRRSTALVENALQRLTSRVGNHTLLRRWKAISPRVLLLEVCPEWFPEKGYTKVALAPPTHRNATALWVHLCFLGWGRRDGSTPLRSLADRLGLIWRGPVKTRNALELALVQVNVRLDEFHEDHAEDAQALNLPKCIKIKETSDGKIKFAAA